MRKMTRISTPYKGKQSKDKDRSKLNQGGKAKRQDPIYTFNRREIGQQKNTPPIESRNKKKENPWQHKLLRLVLILLLAYFAFLLIDQTYTYMQLSQQEERLKKEIDHIKSDKEALKEEIGRLENLDYIEILARRKFGYIREGDILLEIPEEGDKKEE